MGKEDMFEFNNSFTDKLRKIKVRKMLLWPDFPFLIREFIWFYSISGILGSSSTSG